MTPLCFVSSDQYAAWRAAARLSQPGISYCEDCTPAHRAEMTAQGRCEKAAAEAAAERRAAERFADKVDARLEREFLKAQKRERVDARRARGGPLSIAERSRLFRARAKERAENAG